MGKILGIGALTLEAATSGTAIWQMLAEPSGSTLLLIAGTVVAAAPLAWRAGRMAQRSLAELPETFTV